MWDLIVSVPDHCLSFYFLCGLKSVKSYERVTFSYECLSRALYRRDFYGANTLPL